MSDPQLRLIDKAQRRYAGQYEQRLRRRALAARYEANRGQPGRRTQTRA
jgi:hypothetical protein